MNHARIAQLLRQRARLDEALADEFDAESEAQSDGTDSDAHHQCSFCGRHLDETRGLVQGGRGLAICDECIRLSREVLAGRKLEKKRPAGRHVVRPVLGFSAAELDAIREHVRLLLGSEQAICAYASEGLQANGAGHSFVYFVRGPAGRIKIGTAHHVQSRLAGLQTASPEPLELLVAIPGGRALEAGLHATFAESRVSGEWFEPHYDLVELIEWIRALPSRREEQST